MLLGRILDAVLSKLNNLFREICVIYIKIMSETVIRLVGYQKLIKNK